MPVTIPPFASLPLHEDDPPNSAWGLWGNGPESALGSLNHLTDDLVLRTVKEEIQTGERVGLDLPLNAFDPPLMGRTLFEQKIIDKHPTVMNDDVITFNTQGSSQWDSLRHYANQTQQKFYNGVTQQDVLQSDANGLQPWCKRALAGRGVLIDYAAYAERHNISVGHFGPHPVTLQDVQTIAKDQGVEFRTGDVLFLRTGYVRAYQALVTREEREKVASVKHWCGLGQGRDMTEWLWERQFAAVASDTPGFEVKPPLEREWHLHTILLAGWGTPIGELFNLDDLADLCKKHNRWTFFFTSSPLNYAGAVASPPNAVAIM